MNGTLIMCRMQPVILVLSVFAVAWVCACDEEKIPPQTVLRPVRTITVKGTQEGRQRTFSGTAHAGTESRLSFKVSGTVKLIAVKVGDTVKKGDLLAQLDAKDFALQVEQAQASLAQANAGLRNSEAAFARTRELFANRTVSKSEFDRARASAESARASVQAASMQVKILKQQKNYTRLQAPVTGSIASVKAEINENVQPGQVIFGLTSGDKIEVKATVPEGVISKIKKGQPTTIRFNAVPNREFAGAVEEVGISSVESGTTYPVTVKLSETEKSIRAGMAAEVDFEFEQSDDTARILLPPVAVGEDRNGRFVYEVLEVKPGVGEVKRVNVKVGELAGEGLEIVDGLVDGQVVIIAGLRFLEDGLKVRLPNVAGDK